MSSDHDPFTAPCPKSQAPYHLEDIVLRTDERNAAHAAKNKAAEDLVRKGNMEQGVDPTTRPWSQKQTPFYLLGVTAEKKP